eukprot:Rmarinus@m.676
MNVLRALFLLLLPLFAYAYLPGVQVIDWIEGEDIPVKVNKLTSTSTQLPIEYYRLPFCRPDKIEERAENLGEVLRGDRIENSVYKVQALKKIERAILPCDKTKYTRSELKQFQRHIRDNYLVNMVIDNLPAATKLSSGHYLPGFRLGSVIGKNVYVNNHLRFVMKYHDPNKPENVGTDYVSHSCRIVGFEVEPISIQYKWADDDHTSVVPAESNGVTSAGQRVDVETAEIIWTYSVDWEESPVRWASRWDTYMMTAESNIHWFSIVNSLMIVLFLTGMVAMIMMRTLRQDFTRYSKLDEDDEESQDETGWKLVHADVFRPPQWANVLCVLCGTGVQVFGASLATIFFSALGLLNPSYRGSIMTAMLSIFVFMGLFAGYVSARLFKAMRGTEWKKNTLWTAFLVPGVVFVLFFILNIFCWAKGSSQGVPFWNMFELVMMWFGISVPLVFVGAYYGFKKESLQFPCRTTNIARTVPPQAWYMGPLFSIVVGGVLPFGTVFIEMFFILSSIWQHEIYYLFGFLLIVFCILVVTCMEITIVLCYFQLCSEDYHWWWRAFLTSGASAVYLFMYCIFYYHTRLDITDTVSAFLYFGWSLILSILFFVLTGTIGFMSCLWFVMKIYGNIKVD